jgi:hypothetical protein
MALERHDKGDVHCHVKIFQASSLNRCSARPCQIWYYTTHPAAPLLFTSRKRNHFFGIYELLDMTPRTWTFRGLVFVTQDDYSHDHDARCGVLLIRDHAPSFLKLGPIRATFAPESVG